MAGAERRGRIYLVEDDPDIRSVIQDIVLLEGYRVSTAGNGKEALERLRTGDRPNLILLDLMMPVMNGWEFLHERARDPELAAIPVVLLSGQGDLERYAASLGISHFLRKPIDLEELLDALHKYC